MCVDDSDEEVPSGRGPRVYGSGFSVHHSSWFRALRSGGFGLSVQVTRVCIDDSDNEVSYGLFVLKHTHTHTDKPSAPNLQPYDLDPAHADRTSLRGRTRIARVCAGHVTRGHVTACVPHTGREAYSETQG